MENIFQRGQHGKSIQEAEQQVLSGRFKLDGKEIWFSTKTGNRKEAQALADLWKSNVAPRRFNGHATFLKSMFRVLRVKASLLSNVWDGIKTMDQDTQGRENFTADELHAICTRATGSTRYMVGIGLYTGMRLGRTWCTSAGWTSGRTASGSSTRNPPEREADHLADTPASSRAAR